MVIWLRESTGRGRLCLIRQSTLKKSFLGFQKSSAVDFQGSVVISVVARRPPVHMQISQSLIVSSYFNLLHGVVGEGRRKEGGYEENMRHKEERWWTRKRRKGSGSRQQRNERKSIKLNTIDEEMLEVEEGKMFDWKNWGDGHESEERYYSINKLGEYLVEQDVSAARRWAAGRNI